MSWRNCASRSARYCPTRPRGGERPLSATAPQSRAGGSSCLLSPRTLESTGVDGIEAELVDATRHARTQELSSIRARSRRCPWRSSDGSWQRRSRRCSRDPENSGRSASGRRRFPSLRYRSLHALAAMRRITMARRIGGVPSLGREKHVSSRLQVGVFTDNARRLTIRVLYKMPPELRAAPCYP